jgi:hypothetical protein
MPWSISPSVAACYHFRPEATLKLVIGLLVAATCLSASTCSVSVTVLGGPSSGSYSPGCGQQILFPPDGGLSSSLGAGFNPNTVELVINAGSSGLNSLFTTITAVATYQSDSPMYLLPGSGTGTFHALVDSFSLTESTEGFRGVTGSEQFTIGSSVISCLSGCAAPEVSLEEYSVTGLVPLGQPFQVSFSMTLNASANSGEQEMADVRGGISALRFYDQFGDAIEPIPEPRTILLLAPGLFLVMARPRSRSGADRKSAESRGPR